MAKGKRKSQDAKSKGKAKIKSRATHHGLENEVNKQMSKLPAAILK